MFESEEPEDWHKKFHHDMALNFYGHDNRLVKLEERMTVLEGKVRRLENVECKTNS
jgi:hypothetical protein